jgi:hypothetical protein
VQQSGWKGPISAELLAFNSFVRALSRSLRTLLEATAFNLLLRGDARRAREDYLEIAISLPFHYDANVGMGVMCKAYCDLIYTLALKRNLDKDVLGTEQWTQAKEQAAAMLGPGDGEGFFQDVRNVRAELERGFRFWDVVRAILTFFFSPPLTWTCRGCLFLGALGSQAPPCRESNKRRLVGSVRGLASLAVTFPAAHVANTHSVDQVNTMMLMLMVMIGPQ